MRRTNFEKVIEFNRICGIQTYDNPRPEIITDNPELTKLRLDLIIEETNELKEAIETTNFTEVADALTDILYVVYGAGASFGIDLNRALDMVHQSNMSKLCSTEEEAIETVEWYRENEASEHYDSPAYRPCEYNDQWIVYNESTGKILKSIHYTPADFVTFLS